MLHKITFNDERTMRPIYAETLADARHEMQRAGLYPDDIAVVRMIEPDAVDRMHRALADVRYLSTDDIDAYLEWDALTHGTAR